MTSFVIIATARAKSTQAAHTVQKLLSAVRDDVAKNEPGTRFYYPARDTADPLAFTILEEYDDEAAQAKHRAGGPFLAFKSALPDLLDGELHLQKLHRF